MKVFIVMYLIVLCLKSLGAHADPGCDAIAGAYISSAPAGQALQALSEGQAARAACERGVPISTLLQQLQHRKPVISYAYRPAAPAAPNAPSTVVCGNYGYGTGVICTVH